MASAGAVARVLERARIRIAQQEFIDRLLEEALLDLAAATDDHRPHPSGVVTLIGLAVSRVRRARAAI